MKYTLFIVYFCIVLVVLRRETMIAGLYIVC